jgi:hypothetical protein
MSAEIEGVRKYLFEANNSGYGNPTVKIEKADDGGHIINHTKDNWHFCDYFYGGHPYAGQEVVYKDDKPIWAMQYRGWVHNTKLTSNDVYAFLRKALLKAPEQHPYRGPKEYVEDNLVYRNSWNGDMSNFVGEEIILKNNDEIYKGLYFGGVVDE